MRSALIFASLNDAGENEGAYNLVFTALLAVALTLVGLHLRGAAALHADRRTDAVAYRSLQEAFDIFKPLGFTKLEEPNSSQCQMDTMDGRHLLLLATGTRTIRMPVGEAEETG
jgi:hypothetical protein